MYAVGWHPTCTAALPLGWSSVVVTSLYLVVPTTYEWYASTLVFPSSKLTSDHSMPRSVTLQARATSRPGEGPDPGCRCESNMSYFQVFHMQLFHMQRKPRFSVRVRMKLGFGHEQTRTYYLGTGQWTGARP